MWQITVMNWVFKIFKYLKEKIYKPKAVAITSHNPYMLYNEHVAKGIRYKGTLMMRADEILYIANEDIPEGTPFKEGTTGATWGVTNSKTNPIVNIEPTKNESYPGFDATGKMIFDDEPKANKKYWVDRDLESTKHLMRMQKLVAKSIRDDQSLLNTLKTEIQKLYLLCEPDVNTIPMQMAFMALNTLRDEQRAVKKRLANNARTAYWLKQQLK